jgi:hypothetical protein
LKRGGAFGRPKVQAIEKFKKIYDHWKAGEMTAVKAMGEFNAKKTTFLQVG